MPDVRRTRRLLLAEPMRAGLEFAALGASAWSLAPRGDGHTVLVLRGLSASDASTRLLRHYLRFLGYNVLPWDLGRNTGFTRKWRELESRFAAVLATAQAAGLDVSVVGQSLGGTMAMRLAEQFPGWIRRVVTLGSPMLGSFDGIAPIVRTVYRTLNANGQTVDMETAPRAAEQSAEQSAGEPGGFAGPRVTTIFSRTDGIVPWRLAQRADVAAEAVEVRGSHLGMGLNAGVLYAIAHRLAERGDKPFVAPPLLSGYFP